MNCYFLFGGHWSHEYTGNAINTQTQGCVIIKTYKNGMDSGFLSYWVCLVGFFTFWLQIIGMYVRIPVAILLS